MEKREPTILGLRAEAWLLKKPEDKTRKDWAACIASYVVHGPGFHPAWTWW